MKTSFYDFCFSSVSSRKKGKPFIGWLDERRDVRPENVDRLIELRPTCIAITFPPNCCPIVGVHRRHCPRKCIIRASMDGHVPFRRSLPNNKPRSGDPVWTSIKISNVNDHASDGNNHREQKNLCVLLSDTCTPVRTGSESEATEMSVTSPEILCFFPDFNVLRCTCFLCQFCSSVDSRSSPSIKRNRYTKETAGWKKKRGNSKQSLRFTDISTFRIKKKTHQICVINERMLRHALCIPATTAIGCDLI